MLSRRGFIAGLFALPIVKKLEPIAKALVPVAEKILPPSAFIPVEEFFRCGYVWAPYIPLQVTKTFLDPNDFPLRKDMAARYASVKLRKDYYGTVKIKDL